nr:MAG TPA: hypothetical protein [Caudoviricetes sp.]
MWGSGGRWPELIPAWLLAALVTPEFHRGEGFSRLFSDSPWPSGRLLTLPATIPAIPQVLHLPVSPGIHLLVAVMQVGGYRPQFRPHRGVICPGIEPGRLTRSATGRPSPYAAYLWRYRPSYRRTDPQITPRCALIERIGWVNRVRPDHPGPQPSPV